MKFKRFMFKVLRLKVLLPVLIVIIVAVLLCSYFFSGVKTTALDASESNLEFKFEEFKSYEEMTYDKEEVLAGKYIKWYAQNENYVMFFNEATTVVSVYKIPNELKGKAKIEYSEIKDYPVYYQTAKNSIDKAEGANFLLSYADSTTGNTVSTEFNTMTNSVFYTNPLTDQIEHHYFTKDIQDGVQVFYTIGEFSAGAAYFPEKIYQTIYKPYNGQFIKDDGEYDDEAEAMKRSKNKYFYDKEAYQKAMDAWVDYMKMLGVEDPEKASYDEIQVALSQTYEQRFRGNALFKIAGKTYDVSKEAIYSYSGSVTVYTYEAYEYLKELIDKGEIKIYDNSGDEVSPEDVEVDFKYEDGPSGSVLFKYGNASWKFTGVEEKFFSEGEGKYFNCEGSPIIVNTAIPSKFFETDLGYGTAGGNSYAVTSDTENPYKYYYRKSMNGFVKTAIYNMLYKTDNVWEDTVTHYVYKHQDTGEEYIGGGILKVRDGKYVYGENGIEIEPFTLEMAAKDNDLFGIATQTVLAVFGFGVEFKLTDKGLATTIIADSIVDSANAKDKNIKIKFGDQKKDISEVNSKYQILNITVLPQMTTTNSVITDPENGETGYLLIPDGSGAIINFGNGKYEMGYEGVNKVYYGQDNAFASKAQPEDTKDLMLGMFGYICNTTGKARGVLGIIEQGGSQNTLLANTDQYKNYAYFKLTIRRNQEVKIGKGSGARPFYKLAKSIADYDSKYLFMFLDNDELDYSTIANIYQDYLIERDFGVDATTYTGKDTTNNTVVDLNFLGAFEKYSLFLGFKHKIADSLTTFDQAQEIISELKEGVDVDGTKQAIKEYSVSYTSWTNEELEYDLGGRIKVNSVLGGIKSMDQFIKFLDSDGLSLYLETKVTSTKDYDYSFGKLKFNARNVSNNVASVNDYNPSTLRQDKKLSETNYINPMYYINITNYVINNMERINKKTVQNVSYYLNDLGNTTTNSYKAFEEVYGEDTIQYQKKSLELLKEKGNVKVEAPYDYAFKYIDEATNIPLTSTLSPIYDETIPFYQLVISGLFDYSTEDINGTSNKSAKWFYSKAIETGSNLSFILSYENPNILLDTDYTYYYQAYYQNWKETIVEFANKIDESGIHTGKLVYHGSLGKNISFVQYQLKDNSGYINLCVNTTESDYVTDTEFVYNGITIPAGTEVPAYSYCKIA